MNAEQDKAIKKLSNALLQCKKAGICLFGMDDTLLAFEEKEVNELISKGLSQYDAISELNSKSVIIKDYRAYRDSGGW